MSFVQQYNNTEVHAINCQCETKIQKTYSTSKLPYICDTANVDVVCPSAECLLRDDLQWVIDHAKLS